MKFFKGMNPWNKGLTGIYNRKPLEYKKAWLSGFIDGEGSLGAYCSKNGQIGVFITVNLRADDIGILKLISSLFNNEGYLTEHSSEYVSKYDGVNRKPTAVWRIANISVLYEKVIPIFEEYPLLSKKRKHYEIWKKIIKLLYKTKHKQVSRNKVKPEILYLIQKLHEVKKYQEKGAINESFI